MTSRLKPLIGLAVAPIALLPLAGCMTPSTPPTPAAPSQPAAASSAPPAGGGGPLTFELVQSKTATAFAADPNCAYGQWNENSTGVEEEFRSAVTFFRQFDCYKSEADANGIPERLRQSIYVEFADASTARKYADGEAVLYRSLIEGTQVVTVGTGLDAVDMKAYLADLKTACSCGEVIELR